MPATYEGYNLRDVDGFGRYGRLGHMETKITAATVRKAARIRERIEALEKEYDALMPDSGERGTRTAPRKTTAKKKAARKRGKRTLSAEGRARIAAAVKKRWKKAKAAGKNKLG